LPNHCPGQHLHAADAAESGRQRGAGGLYALLLPLLPLLLACLLPLLIGCLCIRCTGCAARCSIADSAAAAAALAAAVAAAPGIPRVFPAAGTQTRTSAAADMSRIPMQLNKPICRSSLDMHAAEEGLRDGLHLELFSDGSALLVRMRPGGGRLLRSEARDPSESASACSRNSRRFQVALLQKTW
jgi:hypothetical protein